MDGYGSLMFVLDLKDTFPSLPSYVATDIMQRKGLKIKPRDPYLRSSSMR